MIEASVLIFGWSVGCWSMWWITKRANERFRHDLIVAAAHLIKQAAQDAINRSAGGPLPDGTVYHVGETGMEIHGPTGADWRER